jgi:peptidyl-prolyl cis-trans isomerase C
VAFIVNGEYIADRLFFEEFRHLGGDKIDLCESEAQRQIEMLHQQAEQNVLNRVILRQMALRSGLSVSEHEVEIERRRLWGSSSNTVCGAGLFQAFRDNLLIDRFCKKLTNHVHRPTRIEVEQFYFVNPDRFHLPERINVAHIIRNINRPENEPGAWEVMEIANEELVSGKPFAKVADCYSDWRGMGGSLGWIARGEMVKEFDDVVFGLEKGERSSIFRTIFGLHIALVLDRRPASIQPLEEIRHSLALNLWESRRQRAIEAALAHAVSHSQIAFVPEVNRGIVRKQESGF